MMCTDICPFDILSYNLLSILRIATNLLQNRPEDAKVEVQSVRFPVYVNKSTI